MYEKPNNMQKIATYSATIRKHANKRTTIVFVEKNIVDKVFMEQCYDVSKSIIWIPPIPIT